MTRRLTALITLVAVAFFVSLGQLSFVSTLPGFLGQFNPLLLSLVFVVFFFDLESALIYAACLGLFNDFFSFAPFGFNLSLWLATVFILHLLLRNWLTNRSFYTFAVLTLAAVLINNLLSALLYLIITTLGPDKAIFFLSHLYFWRSLIWQSVANLILAVIFFNLMNLVGRQLKPFFLAKY